MGLDGNTLYVAETGGETIDIVDLTQMAVSGRITLPPFPRAANAAVINVSAMAAGLTALQFVASNGFLWEVINGEAAPRAGTFVTGLNATTGAQTALSDHRSLHAGIGRRIFGHCAEREHEPERIPL